MWFKVIFVASWLRQWKKIYMQFPSFSFLIAVSQETVYPGEVLELQDSRAAIPLDLQGVLGPEYGLLILYAMNAM